MSPLPSPRRVRLAGLPLLLAGLAAAGCAPAAGPQGHSGPMIDSAPRELPPVEQPGPDPYAGRAPSAVPATAFARGWLAGSATGATRFKREHPTADGRGVLIAILDGGIDPGVRGLLTTSDGQPKLLDLRDFSGEGRIALTPLEPGDGATVAGRPLAGLAALGAGPRWGGIIAERPLGPLPAADLNADGDDADTLAVVVARDSAGWFVLADTDGDGGLDDERRVHDYRVARESFGWRSGREPQIHVAANFGGDPARPVLDLYFDNSGHGTHVAGIAAGHDVYDVAGFDGVAPGARLLGLKIALNSQGGISRTSAMLRATDYAIRTARELDLPLVVNLSFGVGNELEGTARIDRLVDSVLAAHPDVVFVVSGGNDGPGLSTIGFPGSALRAISVGATFPTEFLPAETRKLGDRVVFFSARGGELAKPDVVAPGISFSTVPRWDTGEEQKGGTSMAAPQVAGLTALLLSAAREAGLAPAAHDVKQALMATATPVPGTYLDTGAGLPDVSRAWQWLRAGRRVPRIEVRALGGPGVTAAWYPEGLAAADSLQTFELTPARGAPPIELTLRSDASWLSAPPRIRVDGVTRVTLRYDRSAVRAPGAHVGVVTGWGADTLAGPVIRLVNGIAVPDGADSVEAAPRKIEAGAVRRVFIAADTARPFDVTVSSGGPARAFLFEPGGIPYREGASQTAGAGERSASFLVDGRDVVEGVYEVDAVASPAAATSAAITVRRSPLTLHAGRDGAGLAARFRNVTGRTVQAEAAMLLVGGERRVPVAGDGSAVQAIPFLIPDWARGLGIEVAMDQREWSRFTDFGVTLFDSAGRQIEQSPQNYARGRMQVQLPPEGAPQRVVLKLFPGFADSTAGGWKAMVAIRLYADSAVELEPIAGTGELRVAPGESASLGFREQPSPFPLGDAFVPLGVLAVRADDEVWTREIALPRPLPPIMP